MGIVRNLSIDIETYSDVDLSKCGVYKYVEGDFHILLFAYAFDDEDVKIVDLACGEELPQEVLDAIDDPNVIKWAWNAQFERTCIGHYLGRVLSPDSWGCSMVHAASLSLPLSLKEAAKARSAGREARHQWRTAAEGEGSGVGLWLWRRSRSVDFHGRTRYGPVGRGTA